MANATVQNQDLNKQIDVVTTQLTILQEVIQIFQRSTTTTQAPIGRRQA